MEILALLLVFGVLYAIFHPIKTIGFLLGFLLRLAGVLIAIAILLFIIGTCAGSPNIP